MSRSKAKPRPWPRVQEALRPLNESERDALRAQLERYGVRHAIWTLPDGRIIDGHHRLELARELRISCPKEVIDVPEEEAFRMAVEQNLGRRNLSATERREVIQRLLETNPKATNVEIAAEVGVNRETVRRERERLKASGRTNVHPDLPRRPHSKATPEEKRRAQLMADEGMRAVDIARQLGRPANTISGWLRNPPVLPPDELERRRHERHLRNRAAWRRVLDLNHQALQVWQQDRAAFREAVKAEPNPLTIVDLASAIARTQAVFAQLMTDLDERLDDDQRERVRAFVAASRVGS